MKLINRRIILAVTLIFFIIAGAYATEYIVKNNGVKSGGIIKVSSNGKAVAYISDQVLEKLMENNMKDDQLLKGPTLISAVNAAGVGEYMEIEVKGIGQNNSIILKQKDVNKSLILYMPGNGKIDLVRSGSRDSIVTNVNEINIKL